MKNEKLKESTKERIFDDINIEEFSKKYKTKFKQVPEFPEYILGENGMLIRKPYHTIREDGAVLKYKLYFPKLISIKNKNTNGVNIGYKLSRYNKKYIKNDNYCQDFLTLSNLLGKTFIDDDSTYYYFEGKRTFETKEDFDSYLSSLPSRENLLLYIKGTNENANKKTTKEPNGILRLQIFDKEKNKLLEVGGYQELLDYLNKKDTVRKELKELKVPKDFLQFLRLSKWRDKFFINKTYFINITYSKDRIIKGNFMFNLFFISNYNFTGEEIKNTCERIFNLPEFVFRRFDCVKGFYENYFENTEGKQYEIRNEDGTKSLVNFNIIPDREYKILRNNAGTLFIKSVKKYETSKKRFYHLRKKDNPNLFLSFSNKHVNFTESILNMTQFKEENLEFVKELAKENDCDIFMTNGMIKPKSKILRCEKIVI